MLMASNTVNLGIGYSGMMYIADAGTSLPSSPADTLGASWAEVGAISYDGIEVNFSKDNEPIRDWTKAIRRLPLSTADTRMWCMKLPRRQAAEPPP